MKTRRKPRRLIRAARALPTLTLVVPEDVQADADNRANDLRAALGDLSWLVPVQR